MAFSHSLQVALLFEAKASSDEVQAVAEMIEPEADPAGEEAPEETLQAA